jgi:hypothetical protein
LTNSIEISVFSVNEDKQFNFYFLILLQFIKERPSEELDTKQVLLWQHDHRELQQILADHVNPDSQPALDAFVERA